VLVENIEDSPQGSDIQGLSADLLEAARRRNLSTNSLAAYERSWTRFLAWAAAASFDPRSLLFPTGKTIAVQAMNFYRLSGGQFVDERGQPDMLGLLQQIGAVPSA
jgi:hypothetical protein